MGSEIKQLEELMANYKFNYIAYIVLILIILVNTIRAYNYYEDILVRAEKVSFNFFDLSVSIIAFVGILSTILFHGAISGITENYNDSWLRFDTLILFASASLIGIQSLFFIRKKRKKIPKIRKK
ncbi:MAG: hypothetical protein GX752_03205 [Clostridium sp.]|nr:hypothetical protein [Clostridium sp.]